MKGFGLFNIACQSRHIMLHTYGTAADANTFTHARFAYRIRTIFFLVVLARVAAMTGYRNMYAPVKIARTTWKARTVRDASVSPTETIPHLPAVNLHDKRWPSALGRRGVPNAG